MPSMPKLLLVLAALAILMPAESCPCAERPAAPDPCTLCAGAAKVACPTCLGKGRAALDCVMCRGAGKAPCLHCKIAGELVAKLRDVKIKRGFLPCPNQYCDKKGMVSWASSVQDSSKRQERDPCKVCDGKGVYRCPSCNEGLGPCVLCASRGRIEGTCRDCAGSGKLPCPGCTAKATQASCLFCRNDKKRACEVCKGGTGPATEGKVKCGGCGGSGTKPCTYCRGLGRNACGGCGGTGTMRKEIMGTGEKAGKSKHDSCKGVGWMPCESCKGGKIDCAACQGGEVGVKCVGCRDAKTITCHGCSPGTWTAFEIAGRILHAAGRHLDAAAFYTAALHRVTGVPVNEDPEFPERKRVMDLWLAHERERIEAEAAAADQGKPPPDRR